MKPGRAVRYGPAAALLLCVLAGCTAPTAQVAPPVPPPGPDVTTTGPASGPTDRLREDLLTATDAGAGYATGPDPGPSVALPCGGDVAARFPDAVRVGVVLRDAGAVVEVRQNVAVYADAATAAAAHEATVDGLACGDGVLDGMPVRIGDPQDLGADVGTDVATGWQVRAAGRDVLVVVAQQDTAVVVLRFVASTSTGLAERPDALGLTRTALLRLRPA